MECRSGNQNHSIICILHVKDESINQMNEFFISKMAIGLSKDIKRPFPTIAVTLTKCTKIGVYSQSNTVSKITIFAKENEKTSITNMLSVIRY